MKIIAIANQKGGVGKTTSVINIAHWFAQHGRRVLVVDFDVQGHAATCLGMQKANGLFRLLVNEEPVSDIVSHARPGLDLIASNKTTEKIKIFLSDMVSRELHIAHVLEAAAGDYDMALLDLAPGSDILHVGSLVASVYFLIPAKMDYLALDGVVEVIRTVSSLRKLPNVQPPALIGVLPTMYERTTAETVENVKRLKEAVAAADLVLPPIPQDTRLREATARGLTIWEYASESPAAVGYKNGSVVQNSRGNTGGYLHLCEMIERMIRWGGDLDGN